VLWLPKATASGPTLPSVALCLSDELVRLVVCGLIVTDTQLHRITSCVRVIASWPWKRILYSFMIHDCQSRLCPHIDIGLDYPRHHGRLQFCALPLPLLFQLLSLCQTLPRSPIAQNPVWNSVHVSAPDTRVQIDLAAILVYGQMAHANLQLKLPRCIGLAVTIAGLGLPIAMHVHWNIPLLSC
jgi:hypothetical protein